MIDFEKFSITGNIFKMLLGSFVEEIDAIDDSVEDQSSPDESPPFQAIGSTPTKNLPLRPISEEIHESIPSPVGHPPYGMPQQITQPVQGKTKRSSFSKFFSG